MKNLVEGKWLIIFILLLVITACSEDDEEVDSRRKQVSAIKVIADIMDSKADRINLESPKPFQTLDLLGVGGPINFEFSPNVEYAEIYIFDKAPNIKALREGDTSGCLIGSSALAGHYWHGTQVTLSATESQNQFYKCLSGVDLLSSTEKEVLGAGDYYWFVMSYDSNYLISKSSDVRLFTIE